MKTLVLRRIAGLTALALLILAAMPALAGHVGGHETYPSTSAANNPDFWVAYGANEKGESDWVCVKDDRGSGTPYTLGNPPSGHVWRLLVVKAGSDHNDLYWDPTPGQSYAATGQGAGGWSHVIACSRPIPTTTTTSTTVPETTTTTVADTTTTTVGDTTTTTVADTTTTTVPGDTTTTTVEVEEATTTTTMPEDTTTTTTDVEGATTTTVGEQTTTTSGVTDDTLPFTGVESGPLALMALAAVAAGTALVTMAGNSNEARGSHLVREGDYRVR